MNISVFEVSWIYLDCVVTTGTKPSKLLLGRIDQFVYETYILTDKETSYLLFFSSLDIGEIILNISSVVTFHRELQGCSFLMHTYGKYVPGATFHYEICCYFPQHACTLHALESSFFNGFACRLLRSSDKDLCTTLG